MVKLQQQMTNVTTSSVVDYPDFVIIDNEEGLEEMEELLKSE